MATRYLLTLTRSVLARTGCPFRPLQKSLLRARVERVIVVLHASCSVGTRTWHMQCVCAHPSPFCGWISRELLLQNSRQCTRCARRRNILTNRRGHSDLVSSFDLVQTSNFEHRAPQPLVHHAGNSSQTRLVTRLPLLTVSPQRVSAPFLVWDAGTILADDPLSARLLQARPDGPFGPADDLLCTTQGTWLILMGHKPSS
jgi:hypothetical protein